MADISAIRLRTGDFTEDPDIGDISGIHRAAVVERVTTATTRSYWFISDAIKYLIATEPSRRKTTADNAYVIYPTLDSLDDPLRATCTAR